jgi:hypothetical protein
MMSYATAIIAGFVALITFLQWQTARVQKALRSRSDWIDWLRQMVA